MTLTDDRRAYDELLAELRYAVRKSRQLAEHLAGDLAKDVEVRPLLARLKQISAELDQLEAIRPVLRLVEVEPIWNHPTPLGPSPRA